MIKKYLISEYAKMTATHNYIIGFYENKCIKAYTISLNEDELTEILKLDRASSKNGGTYSIKFRPNKKIRRYIQAKATKEMIICSKVWMEEKFQTTPHNRGQIFENLVISYFELEKSGKANTNFTQCGDAHDKNGIEYQIKFQKAVFTDERTIQNIRAKA